MQLMWRDDFKSDVTWESKYGFVEVNDARKMGAIDDGKPRMESSDVSKSEELDALRDIRTNTDGGVGEVAWPSLLLLLLLLKVCAVVRAVSCCADQQ
jgi:hypothetical protein